MRVVVHHTTRQHLLVRTETCLEMRERPRCPSEEIPEGSALQRAQIEQLSNQATRLGPRPNPWVRYGQSCSQRMHPGDGVRGLGQSERPVEITPRVPLHIRIENSRFGEKLAQGATRSIAAQQWGDGWEPMPPQVLQH